VCEPPVDEVLAALAAALGEALGVEFDAPP
jgi:hypothetical protein